MNYLDLLKHLHQRPEIDHALHAGDLIEWQRAGQIQHGLVDFLHVDDTGTCWAFVTIGENWAAVNVKFATVTTDTIPLSPDVTPPHGGRV